MTTENRDHDSDETWNESDAFVGKLAEALRELQSRFDSFAADIQRCETEREASIATLSENVHTLASMLNRFGTRIDERFAGPSKQEWEQLRQEMSALKGYMLRITSGLNAVSADLRRR